MIETALNTELSDHLGYEKHQPKKGLNRTGFVGDFLFKLSHLT